MRILLIATIVGALVAIAVALRPMPQAHRIAFATGLAIPAADSAAFVRALDRGGSAALADYFYRHPEARPAQLTTLERAATEEHDGTGSRTVSLAPSPEADGGGRMTVILILAKTGEVRWRADRPAAAGGEQMQQVAMRSTDQASGAAVTTTVGYRGAAATRLAVRPPPGVRWDVVVVFSN